MTIKPGLAFAGAIIYALLIVAVAITPIIEKDSKRDIILSMIGIMGAFAAAANAKTAVEAKRAGDNAEASAQIVQESARSSGEKLDKVVAWGNHAYGVALLSSATSLRELANVTGKVGHIRAAEIAEKAYADHMAGQDDARVLEAKKDA